MRGSPQQRIPDPYWPVSPYTEMQLHVEALYAIGGVTSAANLAVYIPVYFPVGCVLYAIRFYAGNGTGNYDIGLYTSDFVRISASGSTAMSAAGIKSHTLPEVSVRAGEIVYAALALSSTSATVMRQLFGTLVATFAGGLLQESSAVPLPATATPVSTADSAVPIIVFGVR